MSHRARGPRGVGLLALIALLAAVPACAGGSPPEVSVQIDAAQQVGTQRLQLGTHLTWQGWATAAVNRQHLRALAPNRININAGFDSDPPVMPAGRVRGAWNFAPLDALVEDVRAAGAQPVLAISHVPAWQLDCAATPPTLTDPSFVAFGEYLARIASYYSKGSMQAEDGRTIANPKGTANRIEHWELWIEPDRPADCPNRAAQGPGLDPAGYVRMWNAVAPRLRAVDPTLKLVGPVTAEPAENYVSELLRAAAPRPDIISYHVYGGAPSWTDADIMIDELQKHRQNMAEVQRSAQGLPIWITELNTFFDPGDAAGRSVNGFGMAWHASAFRELSLAGVAQAQQFMFAHPWGRDLSLVDLGSGRRHLSYWRDHHLARRFPSGSKLLQATSSSDGVAVLAAQPPGSQDLHVLVINLQVEGPTARGGKGKPATVTLKVANGPKVQRVTHLRFDAASDSETGPASEPAPADAPLKVELRGHGFVLLHLAAAP